MKKYVDKITALLLCMVMILSVQGCGTFDDKETNDTTAKVTETAAETTTEEPTTEPFQPVEINIKMVGDILMHSGVSKSGLMNDGTYNYDHMFANIKSEIQTADIAMANQEVILGGTELGLSGYPLFNAAYEVGDALVNAGFNVVLHATNHAMDKGATGIENCLNFWRTKHPETAVLGIAASQEEADKIYIYEKDGVKVAILNYTYSTNGISLPTGRPYMVSMLENTKVVSDIKKADALADFVIVVPHWGMEYTHVPVNQPGIYDEVGWAQTMADSGADLIIAAHPHVIQPVEWITAADGRQVLCYYSLGNFISTQDTSGARMLGGMADVTIESKEDGTVAIKECSVIPVVTHRVFGQGNITTYKLSDYTDALAAVNTIRQFDTGFSVQYCKDLAKQVFGDFYKE